MSLVKCPKCEKEFINTNKKCIYCGYEMNNANNTAFFTLSGNVLVKYSGIDKIVTIPDGVVEIADNAFKDNNYIETVNFSNDVRVIGESAFENCNSLVKIHNYEKIEYYKKNSFKNCGLIELEFTDNTKEIGETAFFENNNLVKINYHPNKNIKLKRSFAKCSKLKEVITDQKYFYPSFGPYEKGDGRPTFYDAFWNTPYSRIMREECYKSYKKKICPDCGGKIKKGIFNAKCKECGIYYKRASWL